MKKIWSLVLFFLTIFIFFTAIGGQKVLADTTYILSDSFGRSPNARSLSENLERKELNTVHHPFTEYGFGVRLKESSVGREYITYDVDGVKKVEVSAIIAQSNFGANHGWGLSLGVTDILENNAFNNVSNIDLNEIYPIYLSEFGHPFIFTQNKWWAYIAGNKYSFVPSSLDVSNQLREFNVPDEVCGELDTDGFTVLNPGYRYPMINLEYYVDGIWYTMCLDKSVYAIKDAEFIGGEKEYFVTVEINKIPETATKVRVGIDYIRETLKGSSAGDTESDVYEKFPVNFYESIYVTNVKLSLSKPYEGGFEELSQTAIYVDGKEAKIIYGLGEDFQSDGLKYFNVLGDGIKERDYDEEAYQIDFSGFKKYGAGFYEIKVNKESYNTSFYVEVRRPDELILDLDKVQTKLNSENHLDFSLLKVVAKTNLGTVNKKEFVEAEIPLEYVKVDDSSVDYAQNGTYQVKVSVLEGMNKVETSFEVEVFNEPKSSSSTLIIILSCASGAVIACGVVIFIFIKKKKKI